jgi:TRAP transporter TAXI family solute receptor
MGSRILAAGLALTMLGVIGCSRGPDATALTTEVRTKLDQRFKPGLFELAGLRRQGSSPLPGSESGAKRMAVYFNATLKLAQSYDFSNWEGLSLASLAQVLGATEKGVFGLRKGDSAPGDVIKVYGSSTYEWTGDRWQSVEAAAAGIAQAAEPGNAAPPVRSKQLVDQLAAMVNIGPPGIPPSEDHLISEELDLAIRAIIARRDRRKHVYVLASGPPAGEYHPIAQAIVGRAGRVGDKIQIRNLTTHGSVENVTLLGSRSADYALVQSNVAAMALAGEGPFAEGGAVTSLRALGSLFPEAVQVVVSAASPIQSVADLRGKRVALGPRRSGTRADALAVLAAHGVTEKDLAEAREDGIESAARLLASQRIDAFFATVGAPAREVQRLAARQPIRLLSLDADAIERLLTQHSGLVRLMVPANTYPGQKEAVTTVAGTALLVTRADVPDREAAQVLSLVFENPDYLAAGSAHGAKISKRSGLRGITIPVHPAAGPYFGAPAAPAATPKG